VGLLGFGSKIKIVTSFEGLWGKEAFNCGCSFWLTMAAQFVPCRAGASSLSSCLNHSFAFLQAIIAQIIWVFHFLCDLT